MKTKQISLFIVIFSAIIISMVFMPNTVLATDISDGMIDMGQIETENPMSETFKKILNEEGKFVVTDSSHQAETDMIEFFNNGYLEKYFAEDGTYTFAAQNYNDNNNGKKTVEIMLCFNGEERHEVEVFFDEQMSENFKKYLKNGSLAIPTSIQEGKEDIIRNYAYTLESGDIMVQAIYINEDCTSCTLQVRERNKIKETHIVPITFVTEKSEEFKIELKLNKDEKLVVNSKELTTLEEIGTYIDIVFEGNVMLYDFAEDGSWCTVTYMPTGETHKLDIIYNYNKENAAKMKEFVKKFPTDRDYFKVQDLELVNYWVNNSDKEDTDTFTNYSGELKKYLNYNNVKLDVIIGAGGDMPYITERIGRAMFKVDGITYYIHEFLGTKGEHILYVPDNTGNTKEELMAAAQKRVDEYLGKPGIVEISYAGTAEECLYKYSYEYECKYFYQPGEEIPTYDEWLLGNQMAYEDFGKDVAGIDGVKANDLAFKLKVKYGENKNREYCILIQKDSSKMINPEYKTVDIYTDIEISSASSEIPLDTSITAKQLTSGTEYEEIIKILDVENSVTFDLTLHSASTGNITKLEKENEDFEVKIPLSEDFEGKTLIAYYVDENNKVHDYTVTLKDGYAIFTTNHFSIYTLAEKKEEVKDENDNNNDSNLGNNEEDNNNPGDKEENNNNDNPSNKEEDNNNNDSGNKEEDKNNNTIGNTITNNTGNTIGNTVNNSINNTVSNNVNNTTTNNTTNNNKNPQTGDAIWIFATILLVSVIGVVITTLYKKESK